MNGDIFLKNNGSKPDSKSDDNFFIKPEQITVNKNESSRHLNDYDYNLLKEDAYKDVKNETFKLEYKINKLEAAIKELDEQIKSASEVNNLQLVENLKIRKNQMEMDLYNLNQIYNETCLSAKISGGIFSKLMNKISILSGIFNKISESLIPKLPGRLSSFFVLKDSLTKLENINKSVDDLISMQIPFGESVDKYAQLSDYIIRANSIQAEISRHIRP